MIGHHVRALRARLGLTQVEFAERAGISQPVLSAVERGANRGSSAAMRASIARAAGLSLDELARYLEQPAPPEQPAEPTRRSA